MKQKLLASAKVTKDIKSTIPKVMKAEIERLCKPKTNVFVERQQFHRLEQHDDEKINDFESRVRAKAALCDFSKGCKSLKCLCCLINTEEEMIKDVIMCNMRDKNTQRELWKRENEGKDLEEILTTCRANEAIHFSQTALSNSVTGTIPKTCHECGKTGHIKKDCTKKLSSTKVDRSCSFCGASKQCRAKNCKGMDNKCTKCSLYGHLPNFCTEFTQSKARKTLERAKVSKDANTIREDDSETTNGIHMVATDVHTTGVHRINHVAMVSPQHVHQIVWCSQKNRYTQQISQPVTPLRLEIETNHCVDMATIDDTVQFPKEPVTAPNKRTLLDTNNCPDTGATIFLTGIHQMQRMGLSRANLYKDQTRCTTADGTPLKILGFIPVLVRVKDGVGEKHVANECLYFAEGVKSTLISLRCLKSLGCVPEHWPLPAQAFGVSERDDMDEEYEPKIVERQPTPERPERPPFPCTEENIGRLKHWLEDVYATSSFNTSSAPMAKMSGPPMKIHVDPNATPVAVHKPIPIPHHWQADVKADLDKDVRMEILEKVPMGVPTTWQSRMVVVSKKSGKPRRTVDLSPLNKHCLRETHTTESPFFQVTRVEPQSFKTVLDAWNGYHAVELDEESRNLTTFITPFGRYRYRRATAERHCKVVDDGLLYDQTIEGNFYHTFDYLKLCGDNGITFNVDKFQFCQREVEFAGFRVTEDGVKPSRQILDNIANFPEPSTLKEARRWFGTVEQVAYAYSDSKLMANFRALQQPKVRFVWTPELRKEFQDARLSGWSRTG